LALRGFATIHIHHPAHAASVIAEVQRDTCARATCEHKQEE
jgi:hypothetical protein